MRSLRAPAPGCPPPSGRTPTTCRRYGREIRPPAPVTLRTGRNSATPSAVSPQPHRPPLRHRRHRRPSGQHGGWCSAGLHRARPSPAAASNGAAIVRGAATSAAPTRRSRTGRYDGGRRNRHGLVLLVVAGLFEGRVGLAPYRRPRASAVFGPVGFIAALVVSMVVLAVAVRTLPVGTAYAGWASAPWVPCWSGCPSSTRPRLPATFSLLPASSQPSWP